MKHRATGSAAGFLSFWHFSSFFPAPTTLESFQQKLLTLPSQEAVLPKPGGATKKSILETRISRYSSLQENVNEAGGLFCRGCPALCPLETPKPWAPTPQCFVPKILPSASCCSLHCCMPWGRRGTEITPHFLLITFCKTRGTNASQPLLATAPLQPRIPNQGLMCNQHIGLGTASLHPRPSLPRVVLPSPFGVVGDAAGGGMGEHAAKQTPLVAPLPGRRLS